MTWAKDLTQPPTEIAESRSSNSSSRMAYRRAATPSARALWGHTSCRRRRQRAGSTNGDGSKICLSVFWDVKILVRALLMFTCVLGLVFTHGHIEFFNKCGLMYNYSTANLDWILIWMMKWNCAKKLYGRINWWRVEHGILSYEQNWHGTHHIHTTIHRPRFAIHFLSSSFIPASFTNPKPYWILSVDSCCFPFSSSCHSCHASFAYLLHIRPF